jgi:hypothetical protein
LKKSTARLSSVRSTPLEYRHTVVRADRYSVLAEWSPQGYTVAAEPLEGRPKAGTSESA